MASELLEKQWRFVRMSNLLMSYAHMQGYELTYGDAYRDDRVPYGHPQSLHRYRLALDFNLFRNGLYLRDTTDHLELGLFWESMGGEWGGRFSDGNHYSLEHNGMK